jgi:hypothetical protein
MGQMRTSRKPVSEQAIREQDKGYNLQNWVVGQWG